MEGGGENEREGGRRWGRGRARVSVFVCVCLPALIWLENKLLFESHWLLFWSLW